ncbi:MAG TPA: MFS transporter [Microvirga sp.]|jgi:MFS family permease
MTADTGREDTGSDGTARRVASGAIAATAAVLFLVAGSVNLPAPLYAAYAAHSGYGTGAATLAFAAYVAGLVPVLLFLGGLSDRVGRKAPLLVALVLMAIGTGLLMWQPGIGMLGVARFLYGVGTGLITGTGTAFMVELMAARGLPPDEASRRGAFAVTASTSLGFGTGALATGLILIGHGSETLTPASYAAYLPLAGLGALVFALLVPGRRQVRASAWIRMPVFPAGTPIYGVAILIAWATVGLVISVFPAALRAHGLSGWSGFSTFLVISAGLLVQPIARRLDPLKSIRIGLVFVPLGYAGLTFGALWPSLPLVLAGAAIVSFSAYGFTYLGGLAAVAGAATEDTRARASSGYFLFAYFGFSVPVITSGFLADRYGLPTALVIFGIATTLASAAVALVLSRRGAGRAIPHRAVSSR